MPLTRLISAHSMRMMSKESRYCELDLIVTNTCSVVGRYTLTKRNREKVYLKVALTCDSVWTIGTCETTCNHFDQTQIRDLLTKSWS